MKTSTIFAVFLVLAVANVAHGLKCLRTLCRECPIKDIDKIDGREECEFRGLVDSTWIGGTGAPADPNAKIPEKMEFSCLYMDATDPKADGDSTDVVRGCVLRHEADAVCKRLEDFSKSKGKNAMCRTCKEDLCNERNGASSAMAASFMMIFAVLISTKLIS